jgi:acetylornithine deacetylase/succinyl-diaminopimelate desuccinylase-like protein
MRWRSRLRSVSTPIQDRPLELLQALLRFDTTNPPGHERACLEWVRGLLEAEGVEVRMLGAAERPNLVARLAGRGTAAPLLLQGHVDVVPAVGDWTHPPFAGEVADGYVWGRGALDMKGGVAMMIAAFLRAVVRAREGEPPPGDVILCLLSDEEDGSAEGAEWLVAAHPELFAGVRYSLGEFGGFTLTVAGRRFAPIMVAEKQILWARTTLRGPAGHGSMPIRGGAMGQLGRLLSRLDRRRLPVHVTPVARSMVEAIAAELPRAQALPLRGLLSPPLTDRVLDLLGDRARFFDPVLHNTISPTGVRGGGTINVIPHELTVDLDCRLLPGFTPDDLVRELRALTGLDDLELEIVRHDPVTAEPDLGLYETLAGVLRELDPGTVPIPMLLPAITDGRFFSRLGIQTYGYLPMQLPEEMAFMSLIHAPDERLPLGAVEHGTEALDRVLRRFG